MVISHHKETGKGNGLDRVSEHTVRETVDVVGVVTPLRGVAQVVLHGVQVVEVGVRLRVHQDRGVEEDGEGQVEVEREVEEGSRGTTHVRHGVKMTDSMNLSQEDP